MPSENSASPSEKLTSTPQRVADDADNDQRSSSTPLAGPGSTRQTRKLQLRKAGFRGKMVPNRNVTPKNNTPSDSWIRRRTPSGPVDFDMQPLSEVHTDGERSRTPSGKSGILQEINNSSLRRKKYSRPRVDEGFPVFQDENTINSPQAACIDTRLDQGPLAEWFVSDLSC